jgi:hypothetical protein
MEPFQLLFEHKGEKIEASIEPWLIDAIITFKFNGGFFYFGTLKAWTKEKEEIRRVLRYTEKYETKVTLTDNNNYNSTFKYKNGELIEARTEVRQLITDDYVTINPKRAFAFWTSLADALRTNPKTPERFKNNLEEITQIKSLDDYIESLSKEKRQTPEELFNEEYLRSEMPDKADHYLNKNHF